MNLTIAEIANACGGELHLKDCSGETEVTSVVLDSRLVTEGGVFVATVGERVDGHSFIGQVADKGVKLIICEKAPDRVERECKVPTEKWCSYLLVEDCFLALKAVAKYYRSKLTLPIVGITGSVGKTSTKEFIAGVLGEKFVVLKTQGNYNNEVGVPLTLLRIRPEHTAAVIEMGISDFGEMHRLSDMVRPNVCVITNIGQCHLENLKTRDGILQAKSEIFDYMDPEGFVVLNGEDDKLSSLKTVLRGKCLENGGKEGTPFFFGRTAQGEVAVSAENIKELGLLGSKANMKIQMDTCNCETEVTIPLPGGHMVINAAAATCVGILLGLTTSEIAEGIAKLQATDGRGKLISLSKYTLIDDCYNANPVSMKAAIDLLSMANTERVAILGDMFELGEDSDVLHRQVGEYGVGSPVERFLFIGANAKHMFKSASEKNESKKLFWFDTNESFLAEYQKKGEELIPNGATVLLKASHGMQFGQLLHFFEEEDRK